MTFLLWALPLAVLVGYSIFAAFKYPRLISNIFMSLVYKASWQPETGARGDRTVILDSSDEEIGALVFEKKAARGTAVFCHESGANKDSWEKYASFLPDAGWRIVSIDFDERMADGEANALTQWPSERDTARLCTAVRWAKKVYPDSPIVLFGVSKGANIALAASFLTPAVNAVVADGLFSMKEIFRDYIRKWAPILVKPNLFGDDYPDWVVNLFTQLGYWHCEGRSKRKFIDVESLLRKKHAPLLMIHGEKDDYVPGSHQRFLHRLEEKRRSAEPLVVPQAAHNEAVTLQRGRYEKAVLDFLSGVLPK